MPHFPVEDQKLRASGLTRRRGGNCANTLEVLSQLVFQQSGSDTEGSESPSGNTQIHLLSVLPSKQSDAVKFVRDSLKNVKMNNSCIFRPTFAEAASSFIIQNEWNNSRTIVSYNELPEMTTKEFIAKAFLLTQVEDALEGWYHFEGRIPEVTRQSVDYLRSAKEQRGFKISVECEKPERQYMGVVAQSADCVFYSKLWAEVSRLSRCSMLCLLASVSRVW